VHSRVVTVIAKPGCSGFDLQVSQTCVSVPCRKHCALDRSDLAEQSFVLIIAADHSCRFAPIEK